MSASSWRERREVYLRERGRWVDVIREGYLQHRLTVVHGAWNGRQFGQSPALIVITNTNPPERGAEARSRGGFEA